MDAGFHKCEDLQVQSGRMHGWKVPLGMSAVQGQGAQSRASSASKGGYEHLNSSTDAFSAPELAGPSLGLEFDDDVTFSGQHACNCLSTLRASMPVAHSRCGQGCSRGHHRPCHGGSAHSCTAFVWQHTSLQDSSLLSVVTLCHRLHVMTLQLASLNALWVNVPQQSASLSGHEWRTCVGNESSYYYSFSAWLTPLLLA